MSKEFSVEKSILINADTTAVWDVIVNPILVKQYMFGTDMTADWKVGGRITYTGEWQGKAYEDGGFILEFDPEKVLKSTYWSSMSGTANTPENQMVITYLLEQKENGTLLRVIQDNNKSEEAKEHSGSNWQMILESMKKICEK